MLSAELFFSPINYARRVGQKQRSIMTDHEISLLELSSLAERTGLGMEQIRECFAIFDQIIPNLGVYQVGAPGMHAFLTPSVARHEAAAG